MLTPLPAQAWIQDYNWTNPARRNYYDSYYGDHVTSYNRGTTAILAVIIYNNHWTPDNKAYFTVRVKMDWATANATSTETDFEMVQGDSHVFEVNIPIPDTVSNRYKHTCTIYSEYREALGGTAYPDEKQTYSNMVVYSSAQSEANSYKMELDAYPYYYAFPVLTPEARELLIRAGVEESIGSRSYERGDFTGARNHYESALNLTKEAYISDTSSLSSFEDAFLALIDAGQSYLSYQGWAFVIASIGFLLMGIGAIVYLVRRSGSPTKSA